MSLQRFGVSMEASLLQRFDRLVRERGYASRSEAIRDMVRNWLVERSWQEEAAEVAGTITLLYDHHQSGLSDLLNDLQHGYHGRILSTMHIHLDHAMCLEVLAVRGGARELSEVAEKLISVRGVKHGKLTMTSTGKEL